MLSHPPTCNRRAKLGQLTHIVYRHCEFGCHRSRKFPDKNPFLDTRGADLAHQKSGDWASAVDSIAIFHSQFPRL